MLCRNRLAWCGKNKSGDKKIWKDKGIVVIMKGEVIKLGTRY